LRSVKRERYFHYTNIPADVGDGVSVGRFLQLAQFGQYREIRFADNVPNILGFMGFLASFDTRRLIEVRPDDGFDDEHNVCGKQIGKPRLGFNVIRRSKEGHSSRLHQCNKRIRHPWPSHTQIGKEPHAYAGTKGKSTSEKPL